MNYRDRAKERRDKYGIDDTPEFSKRKFEMEKQEKSRERTPPPPISDDNIGSRMLKAMGWVRTHTHTHRLHLFFVFSITEFD